MKWLSCDFGGSAVKYAIINDRAEIVESGSVPAPAQSLEAFIAVIRDLYETCGTDTDGVALSLPGVIDAERGIHNGSGVYGSFLKGLPVTELVSRTCGGVRVSMENDGKCGALAEAWHGALQDVRDGVVLILGTGIGGGVIIDGRIHRGFNFSAGEFSYALTDSRDYSLLSQAWMNAAAFGLTYKTCKYKNLSFECQDAAGALKKYDGLIRRQFPAFDEPPRARKADGRQFFAWLDGGDKDCARIYAEFLRSLAVLIHNIQVCIAPERVVIGGGLSRAEHLMDDLNRELDTLYAQGLVTPLLHASVVRSTYLEECNLLGAVYQFIQRYGGQ